MWLLCWPKNCKNQNFLYIIHSIDKKIIKIFYTITQCNANFFGQGPKVIKNYVKQGITVKRKREKKESEKSSDGSDPRIGPRSAQPILKGLGSNYGEGPKLRIEVKDQRAWRALWSIRADYISWFSG